MQLSLHNFLQVVLQAMHILSQRVFVLQINDFDNDNLDGDDIERC